MADNSGAALIDVSDYLDLLAREAAYALGFRLCKYTEPVLERTGPDRLEEGVVYFYNSTGRYDEKGTVLSVYSMYEDTQGYWMIRIKDKTLSFRGVSIGMDALSIEKTLLSANASLLYDGLNNERNIQQYLWGKQAIVNVTYVDGKASEIEYIWRIESKY